MKGPDLFRLLAEVGEDVSESDERMTTLPIMEAEEIGGDPVREREVEDEEGRMLEGRCMDEGVAADEM